MPCRKNNTLAAPSFFDILASLPIEEQRSALDWLREVGTELGCTIDEEVPVPKDFLDFFAGGRTPRSLN